ncbi:MAG: M56 family metallopeptidase [Bacteroides sp.]|nr:M56 family metallopeptidase [Bacteroides sp.]
MLLSALLKQRAFIRSVKRLSLPVSEDTARLADKLAVDMLIAADIKTAALGNIASPMAVGVFKPMLILPNRDFSDNELRLILKHELTHIKHHDLPIKVIMILCGAVHWFNPFIRLFIRAAEQECELYCDENVMRDESGELKKIYCRSILNAVSAEKRINRRLSPALSSNFFLNKKGLKRRITMILSNNKKRGLSAVCALTAALTLLTGAVFAFSSEPRSDSDMGTVTSLYESSSENTDYTAVYNEASTELSRSGSEISEAAFTFVTVTGPDSR